MRDEASASSRELPVWLRPSPLDGRWRTGPVDAIAAAARVEAVALGAVRSSAIDGLVGYGMPCWQVVRPEAEPAPGNTSVVSGRGSTVVEAQIGAWCELIERHYGERASNALRIARASDLAASGARVVSPASMPLPSGVPDPGDAPLAWIEATTADGEPIWLPAHDVLCPFTPPTGAGNPIAWRSTGLAAGASPTEAALYAVLEVIERDALTAAELAERGVSVDLDTVTSPLVLALRRSLAADGIRLEVKLLESLTAAHVYAAVLDDPDPPDAAHLVCGQAAHLDPVLALENAVLEAVQARAVMVAGAREDLDRHGAIVALGVAEARAQLSWWLHSTPGQVPGPANAPHTTADAAAALRGLIDELEADGFGPVCGVTLTPTARRISVVRMVVPGCSDISHENVRLGHRFRVVDE